MVPFIRTILSLSPSELYAWEDELIRSQANYARPKNKIEYMVK